VLLFGCSGKIELNLFFFCVSFPFLVTQVTVDNLAMAAATLDSNQFCYVATVGQLKQCLVDGLAEITPKSFGWQFETLYVNNVFIDKESIDNNRDGNNSSNGVGADNDESSSAASKLSENETTAR
jgi:hypothetical protein